MRIAVWPRRPPKQHVDDRIDQVRVDGEQAGIVPLLGLEHAEDGGQRDGVEVIAEPHRGDAVERHFDVVGGEIAQARRHQPDQPVEDDFQHRQALVGDHRRVDDGANAGIVVEIDVGQAEAEQRVDFFLRQNTFGAALGGLDELAVVDHGGPMRRHGLGVAFGLLGGRGLGRRLLLGVERYAPLGGERVLVDLVFRCHGFTA